MIYTNLLSTKLTKYTRAAATIKGAILQTIFEFILQGVF
jgi:hypothetical protein